MIQYWDTSALVKLVVGEEGSPAARACTEDASYMLTCRIAFVEAMAAIARAQRLDRLSPGAAGMARAGFRGLWQGLLIVEVDQGLVERAAHLAAVHALRGYDATHLAAAVSLQRPGEPVALITWDQDLSAAGRMEGLRPLLEGTR